MNLNLWKSAAQIGAVVALIASAGVFGGLGEPAAKETPAAKAAPAPKAAAGAKHEFNIESGMYAEVCSCRPPCPCELTDVSMGCKGVAAYEIKKGTYDGKDISGTKFAYALSLAEKDGWVHIYVDQKDAKKHDASVAFANGVGSLFGSVSVTKDADIKIEEKDNKYTASVDDGKVMKFETEPKLGGDKKTPITHTNTMDPVNPVFFQGTSVSCTYSGGGKDVKIDKGRNCYFNNHIKSKGEV